MKRRAGSFLALAVLACVAAPLPAGAQTWRLEQPAPPAGAPFKVPLGAPGDLQFLGRNRGLLAIEGNSTIPRGLFGYDGFEWKQLSTVCGGSSDTARIAFAGPNEFWVVSSPSLPRIGNGTALCRFRNGQVVASYSTPEESSDPYRQINSATCNGPNDCWFGGIGTQDPLGERIGAFHLHWDGTNLESVYTPQGRGVSDLEFHQGGLFESVFVGPRSEAGSQPDLAQAETVPRLIHRGVAFANDPFEPAPRPGVPADGTELLALDSDGAQLWAGGGGAASGPSVPDGGSVARPPLAARLNAGTFTEVPLDEAQFGTTERLADAAALPGTSSAWFAVQPFADRRSVNAKAKVARISADGTTETLRLPVAGAGRGSAARIACPAINDCWMVTFGGWLFHWTDGSRPARNLDPAWQGQISFRPNEAAEQFVPDRPPVDDSQLFAPPPLEVVPQSRPPRTRRLKPLIRRVRTKLRGLTLTVSFTLTRRARVTLVAKRKGRVVARKGRRMRPGRRRIVLRLNRKRYPTRLLFKVKERGTGGGGTGGGDDTVRVGRAGRTVPGE